MIWVIALLGSLLHRFLKTNDVEVTLEASDNNVRGCARVTDGGPEPASA